MGQMNEKFPFKLESMLEKESLGERIIISMLQYFQDNNLEDEILEPHPSNPNLFRLVNIGHSRWFVRNVIKKRNVCIINSKNILFCLDFMKEPISL